MRAWIVYNGSAFSEVMMAQVDTFVGAFEEDGIDCTCVLNEHLAAFTGAPVQASGKEMPDFVLFWSKDIVLAKWLEGCGIPVFNTAGGISLSDNKLLTYLALIKEAIPTPATVAFPMLYPGYTSTTEQITFLLDTVEGAFGYPLIIKEAFGSFGLQVQLIENRRDLTAAYQRLMHQPALFQQYIASARGVDMRVQVVGNTAVAAMKRINANDFRSNVTIGGTIEACEIPKDYAIMAVRATKALGLHFAGIDLLMDADGSPIVCEVNSNAFVKNISRISGVDVAGKIVREILSVVLKNRVL